MNKGSAGDLHKVTSIVCYVLKMAGNPHQRFGTLLRLFRGRRERGYGRLRRTPTTNRRLGCRGLLRLGHRTTAERLLLRLEHIEAGEQGWPGTAWALERIYPHRFARPEVMNQIAVVNQGGKAAAERVIVLPGEEFDTLIGRPGYHQRDNGDLERREGTLVYVIVRQQSNWALPMGK
jgi:hypothetical protein